MRHAPLPRPALLLAFLLCACTRPPEVVASAPAEVAAPARGAPDASSPIPSAQPPVPEAGAAACRQDSDCTLTRIDLEGCCETLCVARAVLHTELPALEASRRHCAARGASCPDPVCPPPRFTVQATCRAGRCETSRQLDE